ncbi:MULTISPECIES: putative zinc-binding protein [Burkholderia]|uniref:Zinc-binding protein n=1 Tax=Burkholderia mayonis TaxID=1385591 RepID=A0A1B4FCM9_9BURK|nr:MULTISPECIES: putative zinc-binding protein [Burkholderia]AOJ01427.1 zinc-binding protein [Burkholderia mayonis]KVE34785.1 zinc-binding protein [Burkholderia sp. BDU5]KVE49086.1 zinc-binding protein [Burkholderia mayonis]
MKNETKTLPLVYSCSGCSNVAQLANHVAVRLDRGGDAEMSCIAGIGGDVPSLLKVAHSGRPILVIDGCLLVCAKRSLERHGIVPDAHLQLGEHGVRKRFHEDFDPDDANRVLSLARREALKLAQHEPEPARVDMGADIDAELHDKV